jgi:hypothetical protein
MRRDAAATCTLGPSALVPFMHLLRLLFITCGRSSSRNSQSEAKAANDARRRALAAPGGAEFIIIMLRCIAAGPKNAVCPGSGFVGIAYRPAADALERPPITQFSLSINPFVFRRSAADIDAHTHFGTLSLYMESYNIVLTSERA